MKAEKFSLENLGELSKEEIAKQKEKEAHAEWVEGFKKRKKTEEEERAEDLKTLGERDKKAAAKSRAFRQELEFKKTISGKIEKAEEEERTRDIEKMREEIAPKEEEVLEVEPEQIIEKKPVKKSEKSQEEKNESEMKKHLRANLLDYPELLQPEIKKNLEIIVKQESVIEKNEGNIKKAAQEKVKNAKEVIKRAQAAVDDYVDDLVKQFDTSQNLLMETSRALWGEQKSGKKKASGGMEQKLSNMAGGADWTKGGLFGIKGVFNDRKLKKQLGDKWDEFEVLRGEYKDKEIFYNQRLASHTKRFGRLEETLEAGTSFSIAHRGGGEKLPGVRGR